jgi:hypothetical protein
MQIMYLRYAASYVNPKPFIKSDHGPGFHEAISPNKQIFPDALPTQPAHGPSSVASSVDHGYANRGAEEEWVLGRGVGS